MRGNKTGFRKRKADLRERAKSAANEFMDGIVTGLELKTSDLRYTAQQWIIRRPKVTHGRINAFAVQADNPLIREWNARRAGEKLVKVRPVKEPPVIR